jgi:hypothetical protein
MRPQCLENLPNDPIDFVVVERFVRLHACRNDHGQHHIAARLAGHIAHDAADRLHYIHLGISWR